MRLVSVLAVTLCLAMPGAAVAEEAAKFLFGAKRAPAEMSPASHGSYAKGCVAGATELPETAPGWQAMRLSRNRNWGHPMAIDFIARLSTEAQAIGWPRLYIGDISQPRGGPMVSGHRSHQMGLDIDIWLRPGIARALSRDERENISSIVVTTRDGMDVTREWTPAHHQVLKAAASDPAVARIFVHAAIKQAMCNAEPAGVGRRWLRKVRPWYGHNAHFHVRLICPRDSAGCVEQAPIPPGDGCGEDLAWWFSDEARNPKPTGKPKTPRRELTLADLPMACASVLTR